MTSDEKIVKIKDILREDNSTPAALDKIQEVINAPDGLNGWFRVLDFKYSKNFTIGKNYLVVDGRFTDDFGCELPVVRKLSGFQDFLQYCRDNHLAEGIKVEWRVD